MAPRALKRIKKLRSLFRSPLRSIKNKPHTICQNWQLAKISSATQKEKDILIKIEYFPTQHHRQKQTELTFINTDLGNQRLH